VLAKLAIVVVVLGAVPGALFVAGALPIPEQREDIVVSETRTRSDEELWRDRVGAICARAKEQAKALKRVFRRIYTPAEAVALLDNVLRLSTESNAIFRRLRPPFAFRREARTLRSLFRREEEALAELVRAARHGRRGAFFAAARELADVEARSSRLLADVGVAGCTVKPATVPNRERVRTV
jgi:hypothetical protein